MNVSTFIKIASSLPSDIAILVQGPTGVGKSQISKQIADIHGLPLIDVRGSIMSEGDVGGYPDIEGMKETGVMTFCMPSWFIRACNEPVLLLLDELNRSLPGVQQSFFQLVLDRCLGNDKDGNPYRLHPDTRIIAAVNAGNEYDVNEIDPALLRRFWVTELECTKDDWLSWAESHGIQALIREFIMTHPQHLRVDPSKVEPGTVCPNPASWARLAGSLEYMKLDLNEAAGQKTRPELLYSVSTGFIGTEASVEFTSFIQNYERVLKAEDVLDNWHSTKNRMSDVSNDAINGLIDKIGVHCADNEWTMNQAENVSSFGKSISHEMLIHLWSVCTSTRKLENIQKLHKHIGDYLVKVVNESKDIFNKKD